MDNLITPGWEDYELLDTGNGQRLERFGPYVVVRPDPNVRWKPSQPDLPAWKAPDARYVGKAGSGEWEAQEVLLSGWNIMFEGARFHVRPTPYRHLGLFPEQSAHWRWLQGLVSQHGGKPRLLNLFSYTGAASIVAAKSGAEVCQVDASAGSTNWAKENARLSALPEDAIRWIVDDVLKFMRREVRRGNHYDLIIMDPPVFGRGPKGEIWRLEENIAELASLSAQLLEERPLGLLVNFYATSLYPQSVARVFSDALAGRLSLGLGSLLIQEKHSKKELPTGFFLRS